MLVVSDSILNYQLTPAAKKMKWHFHTSTSWCVKVYEVSVQAINDRTREN